MANTITEVLPKLLAQGLLALRQNSVMPRLVNRSYESLAAQKGNVVNVPIPSSIATRDVTPSVTMAANVDSAPTSVAVTLDFWKEANFQLSDNDVVSAMDGIIPMQASEAIKALGNAIDDFIIGKHVGLYGLVGTPGTTPFNGSLTFAKDARVLLNKQLAPLSDRRAVLDPDAEGNLMINSEILKASERGDTQGIIEGTIARKLGFDWFMDQNLTSARFTPGTGWVTGFSISTVSGLSGTTTLNVLNATASGQIKVGDIFKIDGSSQQYVVTVTTTVSATVASVITFTPALVSSHATAAALTVISAAYVPNLAFHRDAFAWASRPLAEIAGLGNEMISAVDPVSGVALRLEVSRQYKQTTFSYDVLGGAALVRRALAVKIAG